MQLGFPSIVGEEARELQETVLRSVQQHTAPYTVKIKGLDYVLFPDTFNPAYAKPALFLLENLGVKKGDVVLDPFTGSGIDAVFAVLKGASKAVAVDKFTMPWLCTKYNVCRLGLIDKIDVRQGDLFEPLKPKEKFDLIIANPPFKGAYAESDIEASVRDPGHKTLSRFFAGASRRLMPKGRIRLVFSNIGGLEYLDKLVSEHKFESKIVAQTKFASKVVINIYELTKNKKRKKGVG